MLASLCHPTLLEIYGTGVDLDLNPIVVMEYRAAPTLDLVLLERAVPLGNSDVLLLARQLSVALEALHERGITHGHLRPEHVQWEKGDAGHRRVRLAYVPISKLCRDPSGKPTVRDLPYLAPEARSGQFRRGSDVFALGAVLWWAATGRPCRPHAEQPLASTCIERNPGLDPRFAAIVEQMLAANPSSRPTASKLVRIWDECEVVTPRADVAEPARAQPVRVALVDDNPVTARLVHHLLDGLGCAVTEFATAEPLSQRSTPAFDVTVISATLDANLNHVVARLTQASPTVPVVVVASSMSAIERAIEGAHATLVLPAQIPAFTRVIQGVTAAHARPVEEAAHAVAANAAYPLLALARRDPVAALADIEQFIGGFPEWCIALGTAVTGGDGAYVDALCRSLSSRCHHVGAQELVQLVARVRNCILDEDCNAAESVLSELELAYYPVFDQLMSLRRQLAALEEQQ